MAINNEHENTIAGAFGEFEVYGQPQTDEEWRAYDAYLAEEMAAWDAKIAAEAEADFWDVEPSPYDGTYSEM